MADASPDQITYLHGDLDLKIVEARSLPNMDFVVGRLRGCFTCEPCRPTAGSVESNKGGAVRQHRKVISSDPYVTVSVPQATVARTRVIPNSKNPKWDEHFTIPLAHPVVNLEFQVKDNDLFGAEVMGKVKIPAEKLATGEFLSGWYPLIGSYGVPAKEDTALYLEMKFIPVTENPIYKHGIAGDPNHLGVRNTYFPLRKGCSVRLYQDAHVCVEGKLPEIQLDNGKKYDQHSCWEDICYAISEAHHMIYLVGWSIYHKIKLVREPTKPLPRGGDLTLGELLKYKSQEGVRVLLLVWDDRTSHDKLFLRTPGVMATHDEETRRFFKHSSVICVLSPRYGSSKLSFFKQQIVGTAFTHHQKCVLVDTQAPGNNRRITSFIGGIDLCDGRYDTPEHRIFSGLDTIFQGDFHQPTYAAGVKAPRQPWHDLHCRIDGHPAYDVLVNFEQRWAKTTKWTEFAVIKKKMSSWHDDAMIKVERISWILSPARPPVSKDTKHTVIPADDPKLHVLDDSDSESWHVQIFRSIDSGSLKGFPKNVDIARTQNLICAKSQVIEKSIQTAYIQAIRSAQHFIYIENQYFLGSSYGWPSYKDAGADNLIPMELALKITSKIKANERFTVYVVMPMWPEGDPNTMTVQEILFWQYQTIQMMYTLIAKELKSAQIPDAHPLDYLNFYCLGNRERLSDEDLQSSNDANNNKISNSWKSQRFMIYVHSKGMIVDDEYVIIGSANINQRSLAGTKDTEIAMGSYQPHHTWTAKKQRPKGQIYGYRMSLWAEHLGMLDNCIKEPESLECVKKVNDVANDNWSKYIADEYCDLQGHLLKYPINVDADGTVSALTGYETFPDIGGKIIGAHSNTLPDILTT